MKKERPGSLPPRVQKKGDPVRSVLRIAFPIILAAIAVYAFQPVLNLSFAVTWMLALFVAGAAIALDGLLATKKGKDATGRVFLGAVFGVGGPVALMALAMLFSSGIFNADRYRDQLGVEKDASFDAALPPIDIRQAPLVSEDMARRSAEKRLSEMPGLGSQVVIGPMQKQIVDGKLLWVGYLEHSGFFRWLSNKATPGYVTVSAIDPTDVKLVTELGGKKLEMRYLQSAYFGDEVSRHVYFSGHSTLAMSEFIPEIDDSGRPYLVIPMHAKSIGMSGDEVRETLVVDVQTGEIKQYALDQVPAWVDRVQPTEFIKEQIGNRGEYVHGWFNPSKRDQWTTSGDPEIVYGVNGRAYVYQGIRSLGNENAIIGFYLVDSRTKEARRFALSGATEAVAQKAAENVLPEKHYDATSPLPFSVDGRPTFVMALRDASGIPRAYGMVNIETFQIVAVSDTLQDTLRKYQSLLSRDSTRAGVDEQVSQKTLKGRIARIGQVDHGGSTVFYLTLDTDRKHLFVADNSVSEKLSVSRAGDVATVKFEAGEGQVASVTEFDNLSLLDAGSSKGAADADGASAPSADALPQAAAPAAQASEATTPAQAAGGQAAPASGSGAGSAFVPPAIDKMARLRALGAPAH
jgi:hypothetical protein